MIPTFILEEHDILQKDDHVRQLSLEYVGQSDVLLTTSTYGGARINRLGWITVEEMLPYWVGKSVGDYKKGVEELTHDHPALEFIRGPIPDSHKE